MQRIFIAAFVLLAGCQTATEALNVDDVRKVQLVEAECAIYFTVLAQLTAQNRTANGNIAEGCPQSAAQVKADIAPVDPPREIESRYATILYQRMIARGMPKDTADAVSTSNAFYDLVAQNDAVQGGN